MRRSLLALFLANLALATLATPPTFAQGINLFWDDCGGLGNGTINKSFACDANSGTPFTMVLSAYPPVEMPQFVAIDATIDALVNGASLPAWWQMGTGQCRANAMTANCEPTTFGTLGCLDIWDGASVVTISQVMSAPVAWGFRFRIAAAVPEPSPITVDEVGEELVVGLVRISRTKTVGATACAGCYVGACFVASQVRLQQSSGIGDVYLTQPAVGNWVQFNGGTGYYNCYVPAVNRTWGAIKTLYR